MEAEDVDVDIEGVVLKRNRMGIEELGVGIEELEGRY